jgi:hypothetical protein
MNLESPCSQISLGFKRQKVHFKVLKVTAVLTNMRVSKLQLICLKVA